MREKVYGLMTSDGNKYVRIQGGIHSCKHTVLVLMKQKYRSKYFMIAPKSDECLLLKIA
jgi:tRNA 2-selenouridine synthase SelU